MGGGGGRSTHLNILLGMCGSVHPTQTHPFSDLASKIHTYFGPGFWSPYPFADSQTKMVNIMYTQFQTQSNA